jgi:hypothetical protein
MPDGAEGGKTLTVADGKMTEDDSDNDESALESSSDDSKEGLVSLDDIFEEASSVKDKAVNDDLAVKVDKNAATQTDDDEEEVETTEETDKDKIIKAGDETEAIKDKEKLQGESEEDKALRLKRDYSAFKPEDQEFLKKLPNNVFNHVVKAVKARYAVEARLAETQKEIAEFKKNPNRIPDNWYENDRAFELTPEYSKIEQQYSIAEQAAGHWRDQLIAIKNNQPWSGLTYNAQGQLATTGPFQPSPNAEVTVHQNMLQATNSMSQLEASANQLSNQFKQQHAAIAAYYDGPETTAYFQKLHKDLQPVDEECEIFTNVIHPSHKNHPVAKLGAKMFSVLLRQGRMIKALREAANKGKLIQQDGKAAGPSSKKTKVAANGKAGASNEKEVDLDEFDKEMME